MQSVELMAAQPQFVKDGRRRLVIPQAPEVLMSFSLGNQVETGRAFPPFSKVRAWFSFAARVHDLSPPSAPLSLRSEMARSNHDRNYNARCR